MRNSECGIRNAELRIGPVIVGARPRAPRRPVDLRSRSIYEAIRGSLPTCACVRSAPVAPSIPTRGKRATIQALLARRSFALPIRSVFADQWSALRGKILRLALRAREAMTAQGRGLPLPPNLRRRLVQPCRGPATGSSAARGSALTFNLRSDQGIAPYVRLRPFRARRGDLWSPADLRQRAAPPCVKGGCPSAHTGAGGYIFAGRRGISPSHARRLARQQAWNVADKLCSSRVSRASLCFSRVGMPP